MQDLGLGVNARAGPVAKAIAHYLSKMSHELVVVAEPISLDADDGSVISNADQEIPALSIEECGDGLKNSERNPLIVLPALLQDKAQGGLELQRLRLAALDQFLGIAVGA